METGTLLFAILITAIGNFGYHAYRFIKEKDDIEDFVIEGFFTLTILAILIAICI